MFTVSTGTMTAFTVQHAYGYEFLKEKGLKVPWTVAPERIWKWRGTSGLRRRINFFGERFRDGRYTLASFLFAVLLLAVPPPRAQPFVKAWGTCPRALLSRYRWPWISLDDRRRNRDKSSEIIRQKCRHQLSQRCEIMTNRTYKTITYRGPIYKNPQFFLSLS